MEKAATAVLIDTASIQQYIFSASKLKEHIGASFLVKSVYFKNLLGDIPIKTDSGEYLGYIGGGNALLFFNGKEKAIRFVREWTTQLLRYAPGLETAVALQDIENSDDLNDHSKFPIWKDKLFMQLADNKFTFHPRTLLPLHGITAECSRTGFSMEHWLSAGDDSGYISSVASAKLNALDQAKEELRHQFGDILNDKYDFPDELDDLGHSKGDDSHLGIVHIDGNSMGQRFKECKTLADTAALSETVEAAIKDSFRELLQYIIVNIEKIDRLISRRDAAFLPIRPIILGGDDITFVCDGRLGILFAKLFMENFEKKIVSDGKKLSSCGGVAVTKLKYPFYRGYLLAEDLCTNAKIRRKIGNSPGSWIDFHITNTGFSGELTDIRRPYSVTQGDLLSRPYEITPKAGTTSFTSLVKNCAELMKKENGKLVFPNSKLKDLREVLTLGEESTVSFKNELAARGVNLPANGFDTQPGNNLFVDGKTPYYDMLELAELYPDFALEEVSHA